jgi:energy-coupling factor transporter ATP-binding protein EcfA2
VLKAELGDNFDRGLQYLGDWVNASYVGSLAFFYHGSPTELSGIRLRADFLRATPGKDIVKIADDYFDRLGYFGLANFTGKLGIRPTGGLSEAIIVEGEFDALAMLVGNLQAGVLYDVVLSIGGGGDPHLDALQDFGIERCLLVPDSPDHKGDQIAHLMLKENTLPMMVFTWPSNVMAKDPDEAVQTHGWEKWNGSLLAISEDSGAALRRKNFVFPHKWASQQFIQNLADVDSDDVTAIKKLVADTGACLRDPEEQRLFAGVVTGATGIPVGAIFELMVGREETELGYVYRIVHALRASYHFIGVESTPTSVRIHAWNRERRCARAWTITRPTELFGSLSLDLGNIAEWARRVVGIPDWISHKLVNKKVVEVGMLEQGLRQKQYVGIAVEEILKDLPSMSGLQELKAGCHYVPVPTEGKPGDPPAYKNGWVIVNGNSVYLGRYTGDDSLHWSIMDGPRLGPYYFNIVRPPWSTELQSVSDLYEGADYDVSTAFDFIVSGLNLGWKLKNQREDCEYLAAAMLLNTVCSALPRQLYTILNGSRGSGKSKLLGLIAGSLPEVRLLEAAFTMDSYTTAGFRKEMNGCALGACLDEFEDTGETSHSRHVREILHDVRGLTSNKECRILRGNMDSSEATVYTLKCQLWVAAIQYLRDEADVSRFIQVHTELEEGRASPTGALLDNLGEASIAMCRRTLTLGVFKVVPKLLRNIEAIRKYYSSPKVMHTLTVRCGVEVPSRFLEGVLIPAAMMKVAGHDPHDFIQRFVQAKAGYLGRVVKSTHKNTLLGHILSSRIEYKRTESDTRFSTIRTMLSDPADRMNLSATDCGVQYLEFAWKKGLRRWIVVVWPDALHGVLKTIPLYRSETAARLKQMADSDKAHTVDARSVRHVPGGIKQYLKPGISEADYSIYDVSEMLDDWES